MIVNNSCQIKTTPVSYELSLFETLSGVAHYCPVLRYLIRFIVQ